MRVCLPIEEDNGLESEVCAHFGSAPRYLIVDLESGAHHSVVNANPHHAHGMCDPIASLTGEKLDAVVVAGIGLGALRKLRAGGLEVFLADRKTVKGVVDAYAAGELRRVTAALACGHHGRGSNGRGRGGCRGASAGSGRRHRGRGAGGPGPAKSRS